jgi:hypothetical protein
MPQLTWDTVFLALIIGGTGLGFLLRKAKIITYIASIYLAYIFAAEIGLSLNRFLRRLNIDLTTFTVSFFLFLLVLVILAVEDRFLNNQISVPMGMFQNGEGAFYGFLMSCLFISRMFALMDSGTLSRVASRSTIAGYFTNDLIDLFIVILPIAIIATTSLIRRFQGD